MNDISLEKIFHEIFGVRLSLGTQVLNAIRIANPRQSPPIEVRTSRLDRRLEDFLRSEHSTGRRLRKQFPQAIRPLSDCQSCGDFEEDLFEHWQLARAAYARSEIEKAAFTASYIKHCLNGVSTSFAHRMDLHCDALLVDTAAKTNPTSVIPLIESARAIRERYIRQHDFLSAAVGLLREAQLGL